MMRVATVAVALGIIVMIITMSVIGGFKVQINDKLSGLSGHIVVSSIRGVAQSGEYPVMRCEELDSILSFEEQIRRSEFIMRGGIMRGGDGVIEGVMIKGVDSMYNSPFFEKYLIDGHTPRFGASLSRRELLISKDLADDMSLEAGDRAELLFTNDEGSVDRLTFKVGGVFSVGAGEIEKSIVIGDMEAIRKINGWSQDEISGVEIWIRDIDKAEQIAEELNKMVIFASEPSMGGVAAFSIEEIYPALYDWLRTHDVNGVVVVSIMLIVALFNMTTALLILVLERSRMIGILKSLGMGNGALRKIFLYRALGVIVRGLLWGNCVALVVCWVQQRWGVVKLEASGYMLSEVPIELGVWWIVALNVGVVGVILLVMTIPTRIVATITPDEIVKYK